MSQLLQLRAAVITGIETALPGFHVEGHLGRFSAADLSTFITRAPAVRVAVLGIQDAAATGAEGEQIDCIARLGVYVVTKDVGARLTRDEAAAAAVERIALLATGNRWGLDFTRPAAAPNAQNLFSDETLKRGVAMWAIDLPQSVRLALPADDSEIPVGPLRELFIGVAPKVGAAHQADYLGPLPEGSADV